MNHKRLFVIGPRTGKNILQGKNIRQTEDGKDNFDDYWTDEESSVSNESEKLNSPEKKTPKKCLRISHSTPEKENISFVKRTPEKNFETLFDSRKHFPKDASETNNVHEKSSPQSHNYSLRCTPSKTKETDKIVNLMDKTDKTESGVLIKSPLTEAKRKTNFLQNSKECTLRESDKPEMSNTLRTNNSSNDSNHISPSKDIPLSEQSAVSDISTNSCNRIIFLKKALSLPSCIRESTKVSATFVKENIISVTLRQEDFDAFMLKKKAEETSKMDDYDVSVKGMADKNPRTLTNYTNLTKEKPVTHKSSTVESEQENNDDSSLRNTNENNSNINAKKNSVASPSDAKNFPGENDEMNSPMNVRVKRKISRNETANQISTKSKSKYAKMDAYDSNIMKMIQENDNEPINTTLNVSNTLSKHKSLSSVGTNKVSSMKSSKRGLSRSKKLPSRKKTNVTTPISLRNTQPKAKSIHKSNLSVKSFGNDNTSNVNEMTLPKDKNINTSPVSISSSPMKTARNLFNCSVSDDRNNEEIDVDIQAKTLEEQSKTTNKRPSSAKLNDLTMQSSPKRAGEKTFSKYSSLKTREKTTSIEQYTTTVNEGKINSDDFVENGEAYEADCSSDVQSPVKHSKNKKTSIASHCKGLQLLRSSRVAESPKQFEADNSCDIQSPEKCSKVNKTFIASHHKGLQPRSSRMVKSPKLVTPPKNDDIDSNSSQLSKHNDEDLGKAEKSEMIMRTKKNKPLKLISFKRKSTNIKKNLNTSHHHDETIANTPTKKSMKQKKKIINESYFYLNPENNCGQKNIEKAKVSKEMTSRSTDIQNEGDQNVSHQNTDENDKTVEENELSETLNTESHTNKTRSRAIKNRNNSNHFEHIPDTGDEVVEAEKSLQIQSPNNHNFNADFDPEAVQEGNKSKQCLEKAKIQNAMPSPSKSKSSKATEKQKSFSLKRKSSIQNNDNHNSSQHSVRDVDLSDADENPLSENISRQCSTGSRRLKSTEQRQHALNNTEALKEMSPDTLNMPRPTKKKKKKSSNLQDSLNLRRSNRQRYAPLDHWRNERILYGFENGKPIIHGIEKGLRVDDSNVKSLLKRREKNITAEKKKSSKRGKIKILDTTKRKEVCVEVVKYYSDIPWSVPPDMESSEDYMIKKVFDTKSHGFGYIKIKPGKVKPLQYMPHDDIQFLVFMGSVEITFKENSFFLESKDLIIVPRRSAYLIKNEGSITATLQYLIGDFSDIIHKK